MKRHVVLKFFLPVVGLLSLLVALAWFFPERILTVDSGPVKADVMVLLGGGASDRAERVAVLFKEGEALRVICSGYGDDRSCKVRLIKDGVPPRDVLLESKSHTTRENAECSIALLRSLGARRVIIVTAWYHSRRALSCFEHYAPDIQFYSRPSYPGYVGEEPGAGSAEWKRIRGYAHSEYLKLLGYWMCYGVCPL